MSAQQYIHVLLPIGFFAAGVFAAFEMESVIGHNLENSFRLVFFISPEPRPLIEAGVWFWSAVVCFVLTIITGWRAVRYFRHAKHTQADSRPSHGN